MICYGYPCDNCKNKKKELKDGWDICCEAYPKGIPNDVYFKSKIEDLKNCGGKYNYDPISEKFPGI